jgi:hypothetical protein
MWSRFRERASGGTDPGAGHQDLQTAEFGGGKIHRRLEVLRVRYISLGKNSMAAQLLFKGLTSLCIEVYKNHVRAFPKEISCSRFAEPRYPTGDYGCRSR